MTERTQQRVTLPADVLAAIKTLTTDEDLPPGPRLVGVLMIIFGYAWFDRQEAVDPTAVALPAEQWRAVCGMLTSGVALDPIAGVNLGLSFMNSGPSSYDD